MATDVNERVAFGFIATKGDASRVDSSGNGYGPRALIMPITDRDLHFASAADRDTDWNVANPTHPTLYIHSETTPDTDYMTLYHDATNGYVNVVGGNIALQTAGTTRLTISATALTMPDDEILALGTDGDIALVNRATILATNTILASVIVGTPVTPAVAANSLILSNITASGDVLVAANLGGNSQAWLWVDTSASLMTLYGAGVSAIEVGTNIVVNEGSADRDFRIEGDNNANMMVVDAGTDSMSLGVAVVAGAYLTVNGNAVNRAGVTSVGRHVHIPAATITQTNADPTTLAVGAGIYVGVPTLAGANATQTITDAATLFIAGVPAAGTNMTLTRAWAAVIGGRLGIGTDPTAITHDLNTATLVVFNEQAEDIDFRVEGDNNANMLVIDAGTDSMSLGRAVIAGAYLAVDGSAVNRAGVTAVARHLHIPSVTVTQTNADPTTLALGAAFYVGQATLAGANANQTITDAASLIVAAAPAAGTNMTLTRAWAAILGGRVGIGLDPTAITHDINNTTLVVFNEQAADIDFRVEGDNNANMLVLDAGTDSASMGAAVTAGAFLSIDGSAVNRAGVTNVGRGLHMPAATFTQTNADPTTLAVGARVYIGTPTFAGSNANQTISAAASLYIAGLAVAGTNTTITQANTILFGREINHVVRVEGTTTAATAGGSLALAAGRGNTSGAGGDCTIDGGQGGSSGNGGRVLLAAGAGQGAGLRSIVGVNAGLMNDYRTITTISTDSDVVFTAAQVRTGVINRDSITANRNDSMPTAANLVGGLPGAYAGMSFFFVLNNNDDASTLTMTTAAAGITYEGNTAALAAGAARLYLVVITNVTASSEAATVFGL